MIGHLSIEHALPDDEAVDAFCCGDNEVDSFFRQRKWVKGRKISPATYKISQTSDGACVGFVSAAARRLPWPFESSGDVKKKCLAIYVFGIEQRFQGVKDPIHMAAGALDLVERVARDADCVGLHLLVRETNHRAIAFYKRYGFESDPAGPVQRDQKSRHLTMRKELQSATSSDETTREEDPRPTREE